MAARTNAQILNAIRENTKAPMTEQYKALVPLIDGPKTAQEVYDTILNYSSVRNALIPALMDLIIMQSISTAVFENKLTIVKQARMATGAVEQEIFVNFAEEIAHNPYATSDDICKVYESYVMAAYHRVNFNKDYPVTIWYEDLRTAFASDTGLWSMVMAKSQSVVSKANYSEYQNTKAVLVNAYKAGAVYPIHVDAVKDKDTANALLELVQEYVMQGEFPHRDHNFAGADSLTPREDFLFFTTPAVMSKINVQTLAAAFNLDKVEVNVQTVVVDDFGDTNIQAALVNKKFFKIRDQYRYMDQDRFALPGRWNLIYHVKEMFSFSPFYNAYVFTTDSVGVTSITGENVDSYTPGQDIELKATFQPQTAGTPMSIRYKISGNTDPHTLVVPGTNHLLIGQNETAETITIDIESGYDPDVTGTITVSKGA